MRVFSSLFYTDDTHFREVLLGGRPYPDDGPGVYEAVMKYRKFLLREWPTMLQKRA